MNEPGFELWEEFVRKTAGHFRYPPTPHILPALRQRLAGRSTMARRIPWHSGAWLRGAIILFVLAILAGLLAAPAARAAVLDFLEIGVVRIFRQPPSTTPVPPATPLPAGLPSPTARPTPVDLVSLLDLAGETTLEDASRRLSFPLRLPTYPAGLGEPDHVYLQEMGGDVLILVWVDPTYTERVTLSLQAIGPGSWAAEKVRPRIIEETTVNGRPAVWAVGPYILHLRNDPTEIRRLIDGHVLIWTQDDVTYRLETTLPLEEAQRIAESLR